MKFIFEEMGGTYRQEGDYLISNLVLPDTGDYQGGKYGRMHRSYLKERRINFIRNRAEEIILTKLVYA